MLDGKKLRAAMDAVGLRGYELAKLVHLEPCTISKILNNDYHALKLEAAEDIAWAVRKHLCELLKQTHPHTSAEAHAGVT